MEHELDPRILIYACNIRVGFNLVDVRDKVHLVSFFYWLFVIEFGTEVHDREQNQRDVGGDKNIGGPLSFEEDLPPSQL